MNRRIAYSGDIDDSDIRGSVEAGLVLIPTTIFFLLVLQILLSGSWQTIERAKLHDAVIQSAIRESLIPEDAELDEEEVSYFFANSLGGNTEVKISQESNLLGDYRIIESSTRVPIIGDFFESLGIGIFKVRNYAVAVIS